MNSPLMHEYDLKAGLWSAPQKLRITPEKIQFGSVTITKETFEDVKYFADSVVWYKFYVGYEYRIYLKYENDKVLTIPFSNYFKLNTEYGEYYSKISKNIGDYFLLDKINDVIDYFHTTGNLEYTGLIITMDYIQFQNPDEKIAWDNVGIKEYYRYFAIFDKSKPEVHRRVTFDEWNAEVLFHVMKSLISSLQ